MSNKIIYFDILSVLFFFFTTNQNAAKNCSFITINDIKCSINTNYAQIKYVTEYLCLYIYDIFVLLLYFYKSNPIISTISSILCRLINAQCCCKLLHCLTTRDFHKRSKAKIINWNHSLQYFLLVSARLINETEWTNAALKFSILFMALATM